MFGKKEPAATPSLLQVVDALILYDSPMLDQRFQEVIAMHPDAHVRAVLAALPQRVAHGSRLTRRAGTEWERLVRESDLTSEFRDRAERFLLEAFLESALTQIRLKTFMSRQAPTREIRGYIDDAILVHRELVEALREALRALNPTDEERARDDPPRLVGESGPEGDLRSLIERGIREMSATGKQPRQLVLSANALRRLRDQGLFQSGETTLLSVPVQVDFAWQGTSFSLLSFDSVALDEMMQGAAPRAP